MVPRNYCEAAGLGTCVNATNTFYECVNLHAPEANSNGILVILAALCVGENPAKIRTSKLCIVES